MHVFGGICKGVGEAEVIATGLDFAGSKNTDFDLQGGMSTLPVRQALILPITNDSAQIFTGYLAAFKRLKAKNKPREMRRLPFYFSLNAKEPYREVQGVPAIDLYGNQNDDASAEELDAYQFRQNKAGKMIKRKHREGLQRARVSCSTLFNFTAELSGIDLRALHPDWAKISDGESFSRSLNAVFDGATPYAMLESGMEFRSLVGSDGMAIRVLDDHQEVPIQDAVAGISDYFGGYSYLKRYYDLHQPLRTSPLPMPRYIADEIVKLIPERT